MDSNSNYTSVCFKRVRPKRWAFWKRAAHAACPREHNPTPPARIEPSAPPLLRARDNTWHKERERALHTRTPFQTTLLLQSRAITLSTPNDCNAHNATQTKDSPCHTGLYKTKATPPTSAKVHIVARAVWGSQVQHEPQCRTAGQPHLAATPISRWCPGAPSQGLAPFS